ncbi:hypothetical protein MPER_12778 [Moniliophthora perniciosa FA553]|nr:hypothetical protein MPER_12778 [Moniliophthora perniciosa FA553]
MVILVSLLLAAYITHKYKNSKFSSIDSIERLIVATVANVLATIGAIVMGYLPSKMKWARLAGFWLTGWHTISFATRLTPISWLHAQDNLACAPFVVKQNEAPRFPTAIAALVTGYLLTLVAQALQLIYHVWLNARRDKKYGPPNEAASCEAGMQDKTEFENKASFHVCLNEYDFG